MGGVMWIWDETEHTCQLAIQSVHQCLTFGRQKARWYVYVLTAERTVTPLARKTGLAGQECTPGSCCIWETPVWSCQAERNEGYSIQKRSRLETLPSHLPRMKGDKISTGELIGREEEKQKCDQCCVSNKAWNTEIHPSVSRTAETSIAVSGERRAAVEKAMGSLLLNQQHSCESLIVPIRVLERSRLPGI